MIEPRVEELFSWSATSCAAPASRSAVAAGVVLTGGSALMQGMVELGEEDLPHAGARRAVPAGVTGLGGRGAQPALRDGVGSC